MPAISAMQNPNNKLKSMIVTIDGEELNKFTVNSLELAYSNTRCSVYGQLIFDDLNDMNMYVNWPDAIIDISFIDLLDELFNKQFRVIGISEVNNALDRKTIVLDLQDRFSFAFSNSHISRGFNPNLSSAVRDLASDLGVQDLPNLELDFTDVPGSKQMISSRNINSLTFFTRELYRAGFTFYQDKKGVRIKSLEDLIPSSLPVNGEFSDSPRNQFYMNRISSHNILQNNQGNIQAPSNSSYYDPLQKKMVSNSEIPLSNLSLNSKEVNLSRGAAQRDIIQSQGDFKERELQLKRMFMDQTVVDVMVSGYNKNDLNQIYDLYFKGNPTFADSQAKGNELLNGKYVSKLVQEKIVLDSYIQNITLHRADAMDVQD